MRAITSLALGLTLAALSAAPVLAGGWGGRYGAAEPGPAWRYDAGPPPGCDCAPPPGVQLPVSFFAGYGGVGGFEEVDYGGGGGGFVTAGGEARAFASASARVSVSVHTQVHAGGHSHGCGCK